MKSPYPTPAYGPGVGTVYGTAQDMRGAPLPGYGVPPPAQRSQWFHTMSLGLLIFVPSMIFLVNTWLIVYRYHIGAGSVHTFGSLCIIIALIFILAGARQRDGPRYWLNLGILCVLALVAAVIAGTYNWRHNLWEYWACEGQRTYSNVAPTEPALSHLDAGKIEFSNDAHLLTTSAAGFKDEGHIYCVAPIVGSAATAPSMVQYWAAGVDCCTYSGKFTCDDYMNSKAHSGLVYLEPDATGMFSSYLSAQSNAERFKRAAQDASSLHGITAAPDALFVRWVVDPDKAALVAKEKGVHFFLSSNLVYLAICVVLGFMLHFNRRTPPPKWDAHHL